MTPSKFFVVVLAAGLYVAATSVFYEQLLQGLEKYGVLYGALLATFLLWGFPMAGFAAVAPYLVGMRSEKEHAGHSAGWISAVGTFGALVGTFLTSFYFLPVFGTQATFTGNAYAAVIVPLLWLFASDKKWLLAAVVIPLIASSAPAQSTSSDVIHSRDSAYSRLEVADYGSFLALRTDGRSGGVYSIMTKDGSLPLALLYDLFSVPVAAIDARHGLLLGVGAGTLPRIHKELNPNLKITGVEIDPGVVEIGREFFGLGAMDNIEDIKIADARPFLARTTDKYDVIEMDVFRETEIPFYLASKEFFELTKSALSEGGIFMMNIYDPSGERRIEGPIANTAASVYPETYVVPAGPGSFLLVGSESPLVVPSPEGIANQYLRQFTQYFINNAERVAFSPEEDVFTDDRAPIEMLIATLPGLLYNKNP
jgi:spermidine synthase